TRQLLASRTQLLAGMTEESRRIVEELRSTEAQLSRLAFTMEIPDRVAHEKELDAVRERVTDLETALRGSEGTGPARDVAFAEVRHHLPEGSVLVDFFLHRVYRPARKEGEKLVEGETWEEPHVSVWISRFDREQPSWLDLGSASDLEAAVRAFLEDIASSRGVASGSGA